MSFPRGGSVVVALKLIVRGSDQTYTPLDLGFLNRLRFVAVISLTKRP